MKRGQNGFGAVEGLLILILLSILGFTGYYVYHSRNNANSTYNKAATSSNSTPSTSSSKSNNFIFKELGVQFDSPDSLKGLSYTVSDGYLYLTDNAFDSSLNKCPNASDYSDTTGGFTGLGKVVGQYPSNPNPITDGALLKQFPDFYISAGTPNGAYCGDPTISQKIHDDGEAQAKIFGDAFLKTATVVQ